MQGGPKDSPELFEDYDVEEAIKVIRDLGDGLTAATAHTKHHFEIEWVDQLVSRYRERPGKPVVHLSDLPDQVIPTLSGDVRSLLLPNWDRLVSDKGSEWVATHFRGVWDLMKSHKVSRWSTLRLWRSFSKLSGLAVDNLEPFTISIRAAGTGTTRKIQNPKLPFRLGTPAGAKIFGYRGDVTYDTSAFNNKDMGLHDDYRNAVKSVIGDVPIAVHTRFTDQYVRTSVGRCVTILTTVGGLDNSKRQKWALNPLPSWFFLIGRQSLAAGLRAEYDAEGSPTSRGVMLSQAVGTTQLLTRLDLPEAKSVGLRVSKLEPDIQEEIIHRPPLLLTSTALLLRVFGITSFLSPEKVWKTKRDCSIFWRLAIYRMRMMERYRDEIGFSSASKARRLLKHTSHADASPRDRRQVQDSAEKGVTWAASNSKKDS